MDPSVTDFIAREARFGARNYEPLGVVLSRGEGVFVWDTQGHRYLDCLSAYSAVNQGHCHPKILAAMVEQAGRLTLTSRAFHNDQLALFYEEIAALTGSHKVLPMNSGAEAVESAIKSVHTARAAIMAANVVLSFNQITFRTGLLLSLSGTRIHYRKHCSGKVTVVRTHVQ